MKQEVLVSEETTGQKGHKGIVKHISRYNRKSET